MYGETLRDDEVANEKHITETNNIAAFYRYVNKRITNRSNVGVIVDEHGVPVTDELEETLCYRDRLQRLSIPSLELRRLQADLFRCYKIVFVMVDLNFDEFFEWSPQATSCHQRPQI